MRHTKHVSRVCRTHSWHGHCQVPAEAFQNITTSAKGWLVTLFRVVKTVVLGNGGSPLPKTGDFDDNGENDEFAFHTHNKKKGVWSSEPENDENDENDGCRSGKTTVTKSRVFTTPISLKTLSLEKNTHMRSSPPKHPRHSEQIRFCFVCSPFMFGSVLPNISGKFWVSVQLIQLPQRPLVQGVREIHFGHPILAIWGIFWGK